MRLTLILGSLALVAGACTSTAPKTEGDLPTVVTSAYPLAWIAEQVGGGDVAVANLTPPGVEAHDLELTSDDLETIASANLVLYLGSGFQPSIESAVSINAPDTSLDLLTTVPLTNDPEGETDPHIWLDPSNMRTIAAETAAALTEANPSGGATYQANLGQLDAKLAALDEEYRASLADCDSRTMVTSHAAFAYLAAAYDLDQRAIAGVSPSADPDPAQLAELIALVQEEGVTTVFTETLASPRVAETLASEAGVTTEVLDPLEGLTAEGAASGEDYLSVMRDNLAKLRVALGCHAQGEAA